MEEEEATEEEEEGKKRKEEKRTGGVGKRGRRNSRGDIKGVVFFAHPLVFEEVQQHFLGHLRNYISCRDLL